MKNLRFSVVGSWCCWAVLATWNFQVDGQTLINIDFGGRSREGKVGFAGTGLATNDYWNIYRHYDPKFVPGMPFVTNGLLAGLKLADGTATAVSVAVTNAPGVWGNATGDAMYDTYLFAQDGTNLTVTLRNLAAGRYHFYCYGHGDPDVIGEQNSVFTLHSGTNLFGPLTTVGSTGWKVPSPWQENHQYVVFRDVSVWADKPVVMEVAPGAIGSAVLNGMQIISRGTSPTDLLAPAEKPPGATATNLLYSEVRYDGVISDDEARFAVDLAVESPSTNEISGPLFEGEVALLAPNLPAGLRIVSADRRLRLFASSAGSYRVQFDLVAKVNRGESWNQIAFTGPPAAIASVTARASEAGTELQLLSGTPLESDPKPGVGRLQGLLGADRLLSLRWRSKTTEVLRQPFVTVETIAAAQATATVIKHHTQLRYEILQAPLPRLTVALPATHALTRLQGTQIRDWHIEPAPTTAGGKLGQQAGWPAGTQVLTVEFIKPVEKSYELTLLSEQTGPAAVTPLAPPAPLEVARETGSFTLSGEDIVMEIESAAGLRQINSPAGALAAYRFNGRPFLLSVKLTRVEPVVKAADRVSVRLEETRWLATHAVALSVEKAGIYTVEMIPPTNYVVASVEGPGIEDWMFNHGKLQINFTNRVLGARQVQVQLEQALKQFPQRVAAGPLRVTGAAKETAEIGAAAALGINLKTAELTGLREMPINRLSGHTDETLAYRAEQADWQLALTTERLAARTVADVFNLVTIGDGLVGGSATLRFGIFNQGVQDFRVKLPAHWRNVEFTGPGIRRRENQGTNWVISLQDKAWGAYTLVITYDFPFDPKGTNLVLGGARVLGVERETGSLAVTAATGMQMQARSVSESLHRIDESELEPDDRALITRPVVLAYRSTGATNELTLAVTRFESAKLLEAVADRIQLTTILTEDGQMLTQASFMVKNNEKQFQRFHLPAGAQFWSCYVNGQAAKAERDTDWLLAPLPREANRDQAFAVDLVYAQKMGTLSSIRPQKLVLEAPQTDVPNTYAEWELHIPPGQRLSGFAGSVNVKRGTTYGWRDAWQRFLNFYTVAYEEGSGELAGLGVGVLVLLLLMVVARRQGWRGLKVALGVLVGVGVLMAMFLPAFSRAKSWAQLAWAKQDEAASQTQEAQSRVPTTSAPGSQTDLQPQSIVRPPSQPRPAQLPQAPAPTSPEMARRYGLMGERLRGVAGELSQAATTSAAAVAAPMASGIRSIRIEIPRAGQPYQFTKVLNLGGEAITVQARIMSSRAFVTVQAVLEGLAFVAGLIVAGRFARVESRSFLIALGLLMSLGSVGHLLLARRWLHYALILAVPAVILMILAKLALKLWSRPRPPATPPPTGPAAGPSPATPVLAAVMFALFVAASRGFGGERVDPVFTHDPPTATKLASSASRPERRVTAPLTNAVSLISAQYEGTVTGSVVKCDGVLRLMSVATNQSIRLFGEEVAIQQFSASPTNAQLIREGRALSLRLPHSGSATIRFTFLVRLGGDETQRRLRFIPPPALHSRLALRIDGPDVELDFPTAVSLKRVSEAQRTHLDAILGAGEAVELSWKPRVKRAAEIAATVFCQHTTLVTIGGGVANTHTILDYQISQGELRQLRVQLPPGHRLLRVEGEAIRTWSATSPGDVAGAGRSATNQAVPVVTVELLKSVSPSYRLVVDTDRLLEPLPARLPVTVPQALGVKRETGLIAVQGSEDLQLTLEAKDLQRIDAEEFARVTSTRPENVSSVFRFAKPEFTLTAQVEAVRAQVEAVVHNGLNLGVEQASLTAQVQYTIKRAGLFALRLALPEEYRLEAVKGENVLQWIERKENGARVLEVTLKERTLGHYLLRLDLVRTLKVLPPLFSVQGVSPLGTEKLRGFVSVSSELGVAVKTSSFDGLTEIPAASLAQISAPTGNLQSAPQTQMRLPAAADLSPAAGASGSVLAFKFIAAEPSPVAAWKLAVGTEQIEPWVRAEIVSTFALAETLLTGRALVRYEIANAPVKEFRLRVPAEFKNVEITGPNLRRRDQTNEEWRVELQNKVRGYYVLNVTWEQPRPAGTNALELRGLEALKVERETGLLAVVAHPPLQVSETSLGDLLKVDAQEMPAWAGSPSPGTVLACRYLRPGYKLGLEVKRFQEAEVLPALVERAHLTTVLSEDGQMMTELALSLRNHGRQHLEVTPPRGAQIWSAFVGGQPVWPSQQAGKFLVPVPRSGNADTPVSVELMMVSSNSFPRRRGLVELVSPTLDVPLKNARWDLYLPSDFAYRSFAGTMVQENAVVSQPAAGGYTLQTYTLQENRKKIALNEEAQSSLGKAQQQLSQGNVKEAVENYRQVISQKGNLGVRGDRDLQQLEKDLNRVQGSNLLRRQAAFANSQNAFAQNLGSPLAGGQIDNFFNSIEAAQGFQAPANAFNYDNAAAERQWTKLQQAQEVAVAKVLPLHVNLPTAGLPLGFSQILQTEIRKPMTIQFLAASTKAPAWLGRVLTGLIAFLLLWAFTAFALRSRPPR